MAREAASYLEWKGEAVPDSLEPVIVQEKASALMISDADTVANFTNHSYFNLAGHDQGDVLSQQVWIDADYFTPADAGSIPVGTLMPVKGTPMDFTVKKEIGKEIGADFEALLLGKVTIITGY